MKNLMSGNPLASSRTAARRFGTLLETALGSGAVAAIVVFCGGLFVCTVLAYGTELLTELARHGLSIRFLQAVLLISLLCVALIALIRRQQSFPPRIFVPAITAALLLLYAIYALSFEAPWVSDFGRMWTEAGRLVDDGRFAADRIVHQRTLPVLWPAIYLFGHHPIIIPLINVAFLIAILLMGYDVLRRVRNHHSAQIFAVLWLGSAEPMAALKIPTHDLWGLFFIVIAVWWLVIALRTPRQGIVRTLVQGAILGIPIVLIEVQRELGLVALAALATTVLLVPRNSPDPEMPREGRRAQVLYVLAGATLVFFIGISGLKMVGVITSDESYTYLSNVRTATLSPGFSDGSFRYAKRLGEALIQPQELDAQQESARSLFLSDFAEQPRLRAASIAFKMNRLSRLGNQHPFYQNGLTQESPGLARTLSDYNRLYALLIACLFLAVLPFAVAARHNILTMYSLAFLGVLIGGLVTVGEIQTRYVFPIWFFAPVVIASQLGCPRENAWLQHDGNVLKVVFSGLVVGLLAFGASRWLLSQVYTPADGRVIATFVIDSTEGVEPIRDRSPQQIDSLVRNGRSLGIGRLGFSLGATSPTDGPSEITASSRICTGKDRTSLRFGYVMPYVNPEAQGIFELSVSFNGRPIWSRPLPDTGELQDIKIADIAAPAECGDLRYTLAIKNALRRESWVNASLIEIYFPRLAEL